MTLQNKKVFIYLSVFLFNIILAGCSSLILSSGIEENELINKESTKLDIEKKFGNPIMIELLSEPKVVWDLKESEHPINIFVRPELIINKQGKEEWAYPTIKTNLKAKYKYVGIIKKRHDSGEALSLALMTAGVSEVVMTPLSIKERIQEKIYFVVVWYDESGKVVAYKWVN